MTKSKKNALTLGASGSFGKQFLYRQIDGHTVMMPIPNKSGVLTESQQRAKKLFLEASRFAKSAMAHAAMKAEYAAIAKYHRFKSAMVAARTDYLTLPKLGVAYAHIFDGSVGFPITIVLSDNYKAKTLEVSISNKDGTFIESGSATFKFGDSAWSYTTTAPYASIDGLRVKVTVKDRIGRTTIEEKTLNSQE